MTKRRLMIPALLAVAIAATAMGGSGPEPAALMREWDGLYQRIKTGDVEELKTVIGKIKASPGNYPPVLLLAVGARLIQLDAGDSGIRWFYAGSLGTWEDIRLAANYTTVKKTEEVLNWFQTVTSNFEAGETAEKQMAALRWAVAYDAGTKKTYPRQWPSLLNPPPTGPQLGEILPERMWGDADNTERERVLRKMSEVIAGAKRQARPEKDKPTSYRLAHASEIAMPYRLFPAEMHRGDIRKAERLGPKDTKAVVPVLIKEEELPSPSKKSSPEPEEKQEGQEDQEDQEESAWAGIIAWVEATFPDPAEYRKLAVGILAALLVFQWAKKRWHFRTKLEGGLEYEAEIRLHDWMSQSRRDDAQEAMESVVKTTFGHYGAKFAAAVATLYAATEGDYGEFMNLGVEFSGDGRRIRIAIHPIGMNGPLEACKFGSIRKNRAKEFLKLVKTTTSPPPEEDKRFGTIFYTRRDTIRLGATRLARIGS